MVDLIYIPLWNKYRPAILKLMIASADGPQLYRLYEHEFKGLNPKEKGGYAFTLQARNGKAVNNIKKSIVAQNLLNVLGESKKAVELLATETYEFTMDKQFNLRITKLEAQLF